MTRLMCLVALMATAACTRPEVVPTTLSQPVPVAVAVPCLKGGQRPTPPTSLSQDQPVPPPTLTEMVGRFRAKLKQWHEYGVTADALLRICETLPPGDVK